MWKRKTTKNKNPFVPGNDSDHGGNSEVRVAESLGAETTMASGAMPGDKGDFDLEAGEHYSFKGECKATRNESMSLKLSWLHKIRLEALEVNKLPCLTVSFVTPTGEAKDNGDWVLVPARVFKEVFTNNGDNDDCD